MNFDDGVVAAVSKKEPHSLSKQNCASITLVAGLGVKGDAHFGKTVKHRSRVAKDPAQPNLRQVHLIHQELHEELVEKGFRVGPGIMGENITTRGIDILSLPKGALLKIGPDVVVEVTGLRNPCSQLDDYQKGLMKAVLDRSETGELIRKSGVMGVVLSGGAIEAEDKIRIALPDGPHEMLEPI